MSDNTKKLDAVAAMREARDRISEQIDAMTWEEELRWLASQKIEYPFLERLRDRVTDQGTSAAGGKSVP